VDAPGDHVQVRSLGGGVSMLGARLATCLCTVEGRFSAGAARVANNTGAGIVTEKQAWQ
jgi:hypothetical protein